MAQALEGTSTACPLAVIEEQPRVIQETVNDPRGSSGLENSAFSAQNHHVDDPRGSPGRDPCEVVFA